MPIQTGAVAKIAALGLLRSWSIWLEQQMPTTVTSQRASAHNPSPQSPSIEPLALRPRKAWVVLDCSNSFGYGLIASGELESFVSAGGRWITTESIRKYIARRLAKAGKVRETRAKPYKERRKRLQEPTSS
jgi:hypothetical protein